MFFIIRLNNIYFFICDFCVYQQGGLTDHIQSFFWRGGGVAGRGNGFLWGKRGLGLKVVHELPGISREEGGWADIKNLGPVKLV